MVYLATALATESSRPAPDPAGGLLLVANKGDHTLGIIDPVRGPAAGDASRRAASPATR